MRKYLDEIDVTDRPDLWNENDERQEQWAKEREELGFDERETWCLDHSWHLWLYERLKYYKEYATIDLDYHLFSYGDGEYTQGQMIDMLLERLEFSFSKDYNDADNGQWAYVREIENIWALICPTMWWQHEENN